MRIINVVQGTEEWFKAKAGVPSASNFDLIVTTKGEQSKQREKYLYRLAGENIIGKSEESYTNATMQRGQEMEAEARQLYELITGNTVVQVGLCVAEGYAASPDGLVGEDGLLEIKCPLLSTHVCYLMKGELPSDYIQQTQGQLLVTGRKWVDFLSYYPGIAPLIVRVKRDEVFLKKLRIEIELFCGELEEIVSKLRRTNAGS
jgi:putative phage-type endonuclease